MYRGLAAPISPGPLAQAGQHIFNPNVPLHRENNPRVKCGSVIAQGVARLLYAIRLDSLGVLARLRVPLDLLDRCADEEPGTVKPNAYCGSWGQRQLVAQEQLFDGSGTSGALLLFSSLRYHSCLHDCMQT